MATLAEINVRIGTNIKGLEAGLKSAESALRKSAANLESIGSQLTNTLSVGFAAIGVGALKSFGDIEKLQKGLEAQLGSAQAAAAEMEKIREAAKAPGLGFEQFVKGSLQLQAVGDSADKARKTISVFGNALALAGKGAGELDGVVTALTQIKSKGKVMAQEINQIAERLPQIRPAMLDAFGTANSEEIQKLGISATEFVDGVVASLAKLPKAGSSFSNDVTNAFDNVVQGAAKVGASLNSSLKIGERLTALSEWVISAADAFAAMDEGTQRWAIGIAVVAAAIGPAIKAGSALVQVGGAIGNAYTRMTIIAQQWVVAAQNPETKTGLIAWWKGLNTVMKANIIGVTIGIVLALAAAFVLLRKDTSDAAIAQESLVNVQKKAEESIAGQKSQVDVLVASYQKEGATLQQKKAILNELKKISPEYFGTLKVGKGDVDALTKATKAYSDELLRVAKITAAKERLVEIEKALLNVNTAAEPSTLQTLGNAILSGGSAWRFASDQASSYTKNLNAQKKTLETERDALLGLVTSSTLAAAATGSLEDKTKSLGDSSGKLPAKIKTLKDVIYDVSTAASKAKLLGEDEDLAKIEALRKGIVRLIDAGFKPASKEVQDLKMQLDNLTKDFKPVPIDTVPVKPVSTAPLVSQSATPTPLPSADGLKQGFEAIQTPIQKITELIDKMNAGLSTFGTTFQEVSKIVQENGTVMQKGAMAVADAVTQYAEQGGTSFKEFGKVALKAAADVVRSYIMQGVAAAASKALAFLPPPFNIAAAAVAGAAAGVLFNKLLSQIPGFARGTNDAPGGLSLVGERGPELVNLPKHSQVFPSPKTSSMLNNLSGAGNINLGGEFTVRGTDLVLVLENAQKKNNRFR